MKRAPKFEHNHPFDPTYGYELEQLLAVPSPDGPADFADFWRATFEESESAPLSLCRRQIDSPHPGFDLYEVEYESLGGVRIGGWITEPHEVKPGAGGWVVGHGYGGRSAPGFDLPPPDAPAIFPCARGFNRSAHPEIPGEAAGHVLHGIENRDTYSHRGSAADLWRAASALIELHPEAAENLRYFGGSFGGGIGALALPWDARFRKAFLDVPSFGNHPLRVTLPCIGSGHFVRRRHRARPGVLDVLAYFDSATAARRIRIPVFVAAALFDPAVPPPGQFAVYNALAGPRELYVRSNAHFASHLDAEENRELHARLVRWFDGPQITQISTD